MHDVIIIGAGPAGIATAVQLARSGFRPLVIEAAAIGGAIREANLVENYPGFPKGITGAEIANLISQHVDSHDIEVIHDEVSEVTSGENGWNVSTPEASYTAHRVLVASGTRPRLLPDGIPADLSTKQLHYSTESLRRATPKTVAVVGAGDIALDYAESCSLFADKVFVLARGSELKSIIVLSQRVVDNPRIDVLFDHPLMALFEENDKVIISCGDDTIICDEVLVAIGRTPNVGFLDAALLEFHRAGKLDAGNGIYFAGDVIRGIYRQLAVAAGDGLRCAMKISRDRGANL